MSGSDGAHPKSLGFIRILFGLPSLAGLVAGLLDEKIIEAVRFSYRHTRVRSIICGKMSRHFFLESVSKDEPYNSRRGDETDASDQIPE